MKPFVDLWRLSTSRVMLPLYIVILLVLMANLVIQPAIPGLASIVEGGSDSGTASGVVFAVMGLASAISSIGMGWLAGRFGIAASAHRGRCRVSPGDAHPVFRE